MGIFGPSLGDWKNRKDGYRKRYGWCSRCLGTGEVHVINENFVVLNTNQKCGTCNASGKYWYDAPGSEKSTAAASYYGHYIRPYEGKPPLKIYHQESASSSTSSQCNNHNWRFSHSGADKKYPRKHYRCSICGESKVEEN